MSQSNIKKELAVPTTANSNAPKRTFTPNLNVKREKKETPDATPQDDKKLKQNQRVFKPNIDGRARGGNRQASNVIQSHSIFESGPAESLKKYGGQSNDQHMSGSFDRVLGSTNTTSTSTNKLDKEDKKHKQEFSLDDELLVRDLKLEEHMDGVFVKLPQVKAKEIKPLATQVVFRLDEFLKNETNLSKSDEPNLVYFQLPDIYDHESIQEDGKMGKLRIHKSGKMYLHLNESIKLEIRPATDTGFLQNLVAINTDNGFMASLGFIKHKILGIPLIE